MAKKRRPETRERVVQMWPAQLKARAKVQVARGDYPNVQALTIAAVSALLKGKSK